MCFPPEVKKTTLDIETGNSYVLTDTCDMRCVEKFFRIELRHRLNKRFFKKGGHMKRRTLGFKLVTGGIVAVLIPLLVVGFFGAMKSSTALENLALSQSMEIAKGLANMCQLAVKEELKIVSQLSEREGVIDAATQHAKGGGNGEMLNRIMSELAFLQKDAGEEYEVIFIAGLDGKVFADGAGGKYKGMDLSDRDYVKTALAGRINVGSVVKSRGSGLPILTFGAPVYSKSKELVGVICTAPKITFLTDKIDSVKLGQTGYAYVINKEGVLIAHPKKEFILTLNLHEQAGMKDLSDKMLAGQVGHEIYTFQGLKKIAGYAPAPMATWFIAVTQNYDELLAPAHSIRNFIIIMAIIFLIVTVVAVVYLARNISLPIKNAVVQMSEAANQVSAASDQVATASQSLAEGASEEAAAIEETSSSLEEMSSMIKQNAGHAAQADNLMRETKQIVQKANESMLSLTKSMRDISTASDETSKIVKTIDEISFQTNLLALNAAVEAARAGEAGAGFAVVAEEVRNLAMRAAEAAKNTSVLIEDTVRKVKDGSELVVKTNEAFTGIAASASKVGNLVEEIAAASQEQSHGIDQINKAVAEMDKVTQQTAANAEESASASEEMNAQAEQMKHISTTLVTIIGGSSNGAYGDSRVNIQVKDGLRGALSTLKMKKGAGKGFLSHNKAEIIPLD